MPRTRSEIMKEMQDVEEQMRQLDLRNAPSRDYWELRDRRSDLHIELVGAERLARLQSDLDRSIDSSNAEEA